ncbi:carboxylesterase family protein [Sphingomonas sp.]|uniref:carboxylesterase/lipase family protein n=1 Tax=Sphingomonas sp. TaxID=28214 RepID=UPI001B2C590C|nr:carboxylesterase family protein [Sphingomonas sp.]MBO9711454.1 carboxylesterase family protein [Sphingomonas sp.]
MKSLRLLAVSALALATPAAAQSGPIANAPSGAVEGKAEGDLNVYRGIPFAMPPVGAMRWRPPAPMAPWKGVRPATDFGPACIQPSGKGQSVYTPATTMPTSEDCLSLNIWAPKNAKNAPVFVWIHGGALVSGSGREASYDGQRMAERGVIVVSINYRLGILGWLAHPGLSLESPQKVSGNYGLLDQIAALSWIRHNIAAFGGNAQNVTIAGESAGGLSVMYLLESPLARGLFQKAIAQSAYMVAMPELKKSVLGVPSAEAAGQMFAGAMQASDVAALRGLDAQTITDAATKGFFPFGNVDGLVLPQQMTTAFDEKKMAQVPLLIGFNQGEIRSLMVLAPKPPASAADYEAGIRQRYGDLADDFLKLYPAADYKESIIATTRDALYGWTAQRMAIKQTEVGQPAYLYMWDHGYPAMDGAGLHAFHASELPYVFGTFGSIGPNWPKMPDTPEEHGLSDAMLDYWTSFAATGTPVAAKAAAWPAYGTAGNFMHFTDVPRAETGLMPGMYKLNEAVMCRRRASGKVGWNWNVGLAAPGSMAPKAAGCD